MIIKKELQKKENKNYIFINKKKGEIYINDKDIQNFFIKVNYKIFPLLTITGLNNINNNSYLSCLILFKYENTETFTKIFKYLSDNYKFNPKIVNIDYCVDLYKALLLENIFS